MKMLLKRCRGCAEGSYIITDAFDGRITSTIITTCTAAKLGDITVVND